MNAHETQEGVMDSLMEALQTGSAFSRPDQRRKRPTRVAGGKSCRATYVWRRMAKKEQATQRYIFSNNLHNNFAKSKHERVNVTPNGIVTRRDSLRNWMTARLRTTADDLTSYFTPEENQELYKQMLIDEVKRTPKQTRHVSRITYFQKKRQCSNCNRVYFTALPINDDETPRRNVSVKTSGNLESRYVVDADDYYSSPRTGENTLFFNETCIISPVKQKRVIVSKIRRRNSIVRRAILNRKRIRTYNVNAKRRKFCAYVRSPPELRSTSTTLPPVVNRPVLDTCSVSVRRSKSVDSLYAKIVKRASTPLKLLRSKNYENLTRCKDENSNVRNKSKSLNSSLYDMSGIKLLSGSSLSHVANHSTFTVAKDLSVSSAETSIMLVNTHQPSVSRTSDSTIKKNSCNKSNILKHKSWKRSWRFWRKSRTIV